MSTQLLAVLFASLLPLRLLGAQCGAPTVADTVVPGSHQVLLLRVPGVWRDFQPMRYMDAPDYGSNLMVALRVGMLDSSRVRTEVRYRAIWVRSDSLWHALRLDAAWTSWDSLVVAVAARGGPSWPVGSQVDILVDWSASARRFCTLFSGLPITRTD
jgi:hypothetical protein